ncbi:Stage 0 sporulation protein J [Proteiniborus sp. DW1]|uniref:ParB/RepB/Spo0J family partition protein n=1 Tax=Proteiniborus sp. DW1 TaxID=1889883 RepID=UPI00092E0158|nr:ParB/RepB/Spo0J family partition protein [Proteiniborus sp. DW1]SCG84562.1 Stage 0 sporulation protein J [Proteiniborus sp. DW1]
MSVKKRGLGKGLSALIPDEPLKEITDAESNDEKIIFIDISQIAPNIEQPRRDFNNETLDELVASISKHGIIQPIIVRKQDKGYEIVAGERRWRAAQKAGLKEIPAIVKELSQIEVSQIALIENLQREDLNPIEEALAYKNLSGKYKLTQEEISQAVGKSRPYISNVMRLLNLEKEILELISKGTITSGHGRALLTIEDGESRKKLCKTIVDNNLSVRETERLVKNYLEDKDKSKPSKKSKKSSEKDPIILGIEESLRKFFGTKVVVSKGSKKGKIEIEYYSDDDLERILELLS